MSQSVLQQTLSEIRRCTLCAADLPLAPNPIVQASDNARIVLVSQAPGRIAHEKSRAYQDPSGVRLRKWLGVTETEFYDSGRFVIFPMGFCYPGKKGGGDAPPRPECAATWHEKLWASLPHPELTLLIGSYAQAYHLKAKRKKTLTETAKNYHEYLPAFWPIPHPSPRNNIWLSKQPWFEAEVLPAVQQKIREILREDDTIP